MARDFANGSTDIVSSPGSVAPPSAGLTVMAWVKDPDLTNAAGRIVDHGGRYIVNFDSSGNLNFTRDFSGTDGAWRVTAADLASVTLANWNHIVWVHDGTTNAPLCYINGVSMTVTTVTTPVGTPVTTAAVYRIGNSGAGTRSIGGALAYVAVHSVDLTLGEINQHQHFGFTARSVFRCHTLWGDAIEPDLSGNVANGTVTGTTVVANPPIAPRLFPTIPTFFEPKIAVTLYEITFGGTLTSAGSLLKSANKRISGTITITGNLIKRANKVISGGLSPSGAITKLKTHFTVISGALTLSGSIIKHTNKTFSGALTTAGNAIKSVNKSLTGVLSLSGALTKLRTHYEALVGVLLFSGSVIKKTAKSFNGALAIAGSLGTTKVALKILSGAISFTGTITRNTFKSTNGVFALTGALIKSTSKAHSGILSLQGIISKQTNKLLSGNLSLAGALTSFRVILKSIAGVISFNGQLQKQTNKLISGTLTIVGMLSKHAAKTISGTIILQGTLSKRISKFFTGAVSFIGSITRIIPAIPDLYPVINRAVIQLRKYTGAISIFGKNIKSLVVKTKDIL